MFFSLGFNPMFPGSSMGSGSGMTMGSMGGGRNETFSNILAISGRSVSLME
jgi:hypothetical protein